MTDVTVVTQELEVQAAALAQRIPLIAITDQVSLDAAVADRVEIKYRLARIGELMDPICEATNKAHKAATTKREQLRGPFVEADKAYSRAMGAYEQEQERGRHEAARRALLELERLEAEERQRVAREQQRLLREAEEQRLTEAALAEAHGDTETAERLIEATLVVPVVAPRPVFVPSPPPAARPTAPGLSFRDLAWKAEVTDLMTMVQAVAAGTAPLAVLTADMKVLNKLADSLKKAFSIPGATAVPGAPIAPMRSR